MLKGHGNKVVQLGWSILKMDVEKEVGLRMATVEERWCQRVPLEPVVGDEDDYGAFLMLFLNIKIEVKCRDNAIKVLG